MTRDQLLSIPAREARARKYLRSKEVPPTRGNIRAGLAFLLLATVLIIIMMAL